MPCIARLRLFASHIEVTGRNGHVQRFRIKPRTDIMRNIIVSVGICTRNSIPRQHDSISLVILG